MTYRGLSNKEVLRRWKLPDTEVYLLARRCSWLQEMARRPSEHSQVIAALFGELALEREHSVPTPLEMEK